MYKRQLLYGVPQKLTIGKHALELRRIFIFDINGHFGKLLTLIGAGSCRENPRPILIVHLSLIHI